MFLRENTDDLLRKVLTGGMDGMPSRRQSNDDVSNITSLKVMMISEMLHQPLTDSWREYIYILVGYLFHEQSK